MPTNNFKLFDENKANLLTDTEYGNSTQRLNGVQTGVASSQLNNKFAYQVSLVAYSIAQLMNANGLDASDTLAVSAFVGNLQGAILQKVADKATSAEAAAGVLSNKYITPETMKAAALLLSGGVMNGVLDMGNNRITNLGTPTADSDAVTKGYVDGKYSYELIVEKAFSVSKTNVSSIPDTDIGLNLFDVFDEPNDYAIFVNVTGKYRLFKASTGTSNSLFFGIKCNMIDSTLKYLIAGNKIITTISTLQDITYKSAKKLICGYGSTNALKSIYALEDFMDPSGGGRSSPLNAADQPLTFYFGERLGGNLTVNVEVNLKFCKLVT